MNYSPISMWEPSKHKSIGKTTHRHTLGLGTRNLKYPFFHSFPFYRPFFIIHSQTGLTGRAAFYHVPLPRHSRTLTGPINQSCCCPLPHPQYCYLGFSAGHSIIPRLLQMLQMSLTALLWALTHTLHLSSKTQQSQDMWLRKWTQGRQRTLNLDIRDCCVESPLFIPLYNNLPTDHLSLIALLLVPILCHWLEYILTNSSIPALGMQAFNVSGAVSRGCLALYFSRVKMPTCAST